MGGTTDAMKNDRACQSYVRARFLSHAGCPCVAETSTYLPPPLNLDLMYRHFPSALPCALCCSGLDMTRLPTRW